MAALLTKVKARLTLHSHRRTRRLLEGEYTSVFHGHSLDFDDLRGYVPGDEIRDIDWKATARHTSPLVKRYVAHRRHSLGLVVDTGRNFDAVAGSGEPKRDVAIMLAGMAGYLAVRHGDDVMLVHGTGETSWATESKGTEAHLEHILRMIQRSGGEGTPAGDIHRQLSWLAGHMRRRMMIFVITDEAPLREDTVALLRRLVAQHELLWLTVQDADLTAASITDPADLLDAELHPVPDSLRSSPAIHREFAQAEAEAALHRHRQLRKLSIAEVTVPGTGQALTGLRTVMERHRHGSR